MFAKNGYGNSILKACLKESYLMIFLVTFLVWKLFLDLGYFIDNN